MQVNGMTQWNQDPIYPSAPSYTISGWPACTLVTITDAAVNPGARGPSSTVTAYTAVDSMSFIH